MAATLCPACTSPHVRDHCLSRTCWWLYCTSCGAVQDIRNGRWLDRLRRAHSQDRAT